MTVFLNCIFHIPKIKRINDILTENYYYKTYYIKLVDRNVNYSSVYGSNDKNEMLFITTYNDLKNTIIKHFKDIPSIRNSLRKDLIIEVLQ